MNGARTERRWGNVLPTMFYGLQARALGRPMAAVPSERDRLILGELHADGATFVEVRDVMCWLWLDAAGEYWRDRVSDVRGFVNAYDALCDGLDGSVPPWWRATGVRSPQSPSWVVERRVLEDQDRIQQAGMALADLSTPVPRATSQLDECEGNDHGR